MRSVTPLYIVGLLLAGLAGMMLLPLAVGLYYNDGTSTVFIKSIVLTLAASGFLLFAFRPPRPINLSHREGMAVVALAWLGAGLFGALPFALANVFPGYTDCYFEAMSGFTTTGASVMTDIESQARGILFWRSLTHWLGGMGIIVLGVAILPFLGVGGMSLYKAEVPSPVVDRLQPRIAETSRTLWKVYLMLTVAETILLWLGEMDLCDAVCHTFGTLATGGFSTKNASIAAYGPYEQYVIIAFMFLAGVNFSLHFRLLAGRPAAYWRDPEFRAYLILVVAFTVLTVIWLGMAGSFATWEERFRHGLFQVVSILTTTGYATADFELWPTLPQVILVLAMFIGASAGSTGGGIKVMRLILLIKHGYRELKRLIRPRAVYAIKLGGRPVPDDVLNAVWGYLALYLVLFIVGFMALAAMGLDLVTSFSAVAASIGNIGPGLGLVGPADNYAAIPWLGKWVLIICMLLGRLEIYTVIILLVPAFWRK